jgi:hypothetical protein
MSRDVIADQYSESQDDVIFCFIQFLRKENPGIT